MIDKNMHVLFRSLCTVYNNKIVAALQQRPCLLTAVTATTQSNRLHSLHTCFFRAGPLNRRKCWATQTWIRNTRDSNFVDRTEAHVQRNDMTEFRWLAA